MKKYINSIINSNYFLLFLSSITCFTLSFFKIIDGLNIFSLVILMIIYWFYIKVDLRRKNKIDIKYSLILGFIFTMLFIVGWHISGGLFIKEPIITSILNLKTFFCFIGLLPLFSFVNLYLFTELRKIRIKEYKITNKKIYWLSFFSMLSVWFIYFGLFFPGSLSPDSIVQLKQIITPDIYPLRDWHPIFHTLYIGLFYKIGLFIFKSPNLAIGFLSFSQMVILSSIFSYIILYLKKQGLSKKILILFIIYFSLSPIFGYYSITIWKDVIFGAITSLVIINIYNFLKNWKNIKTKDYLGLFFITLLWTLFRNNGIYIVYLMIIMAIILFKKESFKLLLVFLIVISSYKLIKGPIFNAFNIKKTSSSEYIAIPLQQVSRIIWLDGDVAKKDLETINKLIPIEEIKKVYTPQVSDPIKFSKNYNEDFFNKHKKEFLMIYLRTIKRNPSIAIDSYLASTIGYWYPNQIYWAYANSIWINDLGFKTTPFIKSNKIRKLINKISDPYLSIISIYLRVAIYFWIILFFLFLIVRNKGIKYIYPFMPVIGIWLTLMMASPVFGEFRYIFGAVTSLPLVIGLALSKEKEKK